MIEDTSPQGILLIDKPKGPTSFDIVAKVRRALGVKTVGHAGTLDPMATGLLVILVGRKYTRMSAELTGQDKVYEAEISFGRATNTDDAEGETLAQGDASHLTKNQIADALKVFLGPQNQMPPQFSAISVGGKRAYAMARKGLVVELAPRPIVINKIELLEYSSEQAAAKILVHCSKGTYIRALARDLGAKVGVPAHLSALRRLASGRFSVKEAILVQDLANAGPVVALIAG